MSDKMMWKINEKKVEFISSFDGSDFIVYELFA